MAACRSVTNASLFAISRPELEKLQIDAGVVAVTSHCAQKQQAGAAVDKGSFCYRRLLRLQQWHARRASWDRFIFQADRSTRECGLRHFGVGLELVRTASAGTAAEHAVDMYVSLNRYLVSRSLSAALPAPSLLTDLDEDELKKI